MQSLVERFRLAAMKDRLSSSLTLLGLDEIRQSGASSIQICRRMRQLLDDLLCVAVEPRRAVLRHQLELLDAAVADRHPAPHERELARRPSSQSHGPSDTPHGPTPR